MSGLVATDISGNAPGNITPRKAQQIVSGTFGATGQSSSFISGNKFNFSLSGTWAGTVSLDRSFDRGVTWVVVTSYTANTQQQVIEPEDRVYYRVNCSAYTSGTVVYRLGI